MRYQWKGIAGKWNVYDEEGTRIGSVCRTMKQTLEYHYGDKSQTYHIRRQKDSIWLEQDGIPCLTGCFCYPVDADGKRIQEFLFRPPMPTELKLEGADETWTLHQLSNRNIEIYHNQEQVGLLTGMVIGKKTLEWTGGTALLEKGLLCFALGVYMEEDDTVYAV